MRAKWLIFTALIATWACSNDDDDVTPIDAAGSGGEGDAGQADSGGAGGQVLGGGGADAGASGGNVSNCTLDDAVCPQVDSCGPYPLAELCSAQAGTCPGMDELDLDELCAMDSTLTMRELSCGGRLVEYVGYAGLVEESWGFDANGVLVYKEMGNDFIQPCRDGKTKSAITTWGALPCSASGATTVVCGGGGEGGGAN